MLIAEVNIFVHYKSKEFEFKWFNYSDDKTEFLMELSDMLFEGLVEDLSRQLLGLPIDFYYEEEEEQG